MNKSTNKQGWTITFAALGINLVMGVLYSWGVIKKALVSDWGWTNTDAALPFTVSAAVFAVTMIFAGSYSRIDADRPPSKYCRSSGRLENCRVHAGSYSICF